MTITYKSSSLLAALFVGVALLAATSGAMAEGVGASTASDKISIGTMSVIIAPAASVEGSTKGEPLDGLGLSGAGGAFVVSGIVQGAGETADVILDAVGTAGKISVKLSKSAVQSLALSTGTAVRVISETTGTTLVASGKVIAFIPNKLGEALLAQARLQTK
jgi:hypothetical protein